MVRLDGFLPAAGGDGQRLADQILRPLPETVFEKERSVLREDLRLDAGGADRLVQVAAAEKAGDHVAVRELFRTAEQRLQQVRHPGAVRQLIQPASHRLPEKFPQERIRLGGAGFHAGLEGDPAVPQPDALRHEVFHKAPGPDQLCPVVLPERQKLPPGGVDREQRVQKIRLAEKAQAVAHRALQRVVQQEAQGRLETGGVQLLHSIFPRCRHRRLLLYLSLVHWVGHWGRFSLTHKMPTVLRKKWVSQNRPQ